MNYTPNMIAKTPAMEQEEQRIQTAIMRKELFFSQLFGDYWKSDTERILREAISAEIPRQGKYHRIILMEIETCGSYYTRKANHGVQDERSEMQFILTNLGNSLFSMNGRCQVCFCNYESRLIFWINAQDTACSSKDFAQAAEQVTQTVEEQYQMFLSTVVGDWFEPLSSAVSEYQRTKDTLFYHRFLADPQSVFVTEPVKAELNRPRFSQYIRNAETIFLSIREHKYEDAREQLKQMYQTMFVLKPKTLQTYRYYQNYLFDLLEMTLWELDEMLPGVIPSVQIFHAMRTAESGREWLEEMDQAFDLAIDYNQERQRMPAWVFTLQDIVREEYTDVNLSVYSLADRVGLGASYCTRMFRRYVGMSLMEFLQTERRKAAITLIADGYSMKEVAQRSGFGCVRTLQRTLQRYDSKNKS